MSNCASPMVAEVYRKEGALLQVGGCGYNKGMIPQHHVHNVVRREVSNTQEVIFVRSGKVAASIFNEDIGLVERLELSAWDTLISLNCGHGYEILEDNTKVLEVKNGPYPGAEVDRRRIEWPKP